MINEPTNPIIDFDKEPVAFLNFTLHRYMNDCMFMEATNAREVVSANAERAIDTNVDIVRVEQKIISRSVEGRDKTAWEIHCYKVIPHTSGIDVLRTLEEVNECVTVPRDYPHKIYGYRREQYKSRFAAMKAANYNCEGHNNVPSYELINSELFCSE